MISRDAVPIAHHPPRKPIDLRLTYPHAQTESRTFWEIQYEESIRIERGLRNEKMWRAVVEFAQGRGSVPLDGHFPQRGSGADALNQSEARVTADEAQNEPAAECTALEDDRNSTDWIVTPLRQWVVGEYLADVPTEVYQPPGTTWMTLDEARERFPDAFDRQEAEQSWGAFKEYWQGSPSDENELGGEGLEGE